MPLYSYVCEVCKLPFDEFAKMEDYEKDQPCPTCGGAGKRVVCQVSTDMVENVRHSEALAVHPSQVADGSAAKMHPGAKFDSMGRMIIHNRKEKLQRIKERNAYLGTNLHELD